MTLDEPIASEVATRMRLLLRMGTPLAKIAVVVVTAPPEAMPPPAKVDPRSRLNASTPFYTGGAVCMVGTLNSLHATIATTGFHGAKDAQAALTRPPRAGHVWALLADMTGWCRVEEITPPTIESDA